MESSLTEPNADEISEEEKKNIISLQEYIDDLNKRQKWRQQLRKANSDHTNRLDESELRKFDSSLKKVNFQNKIMIIWKMLSFSPGLIKKLLK